MTIKIVTSLKKAVIQQTKSSYIGLKWRIKASI